MDRRDFLRQLALLSASGFLMLDADSWAARDLDERKSRKRLVVVSLRGAVDGLNVVVPYTEGAYYVVRPTIAIPRPGGDGGLLDLDGHFGLHPSLAPLASLWSNGTLAFVHACGSPDMTRSHFDAQDYMETGTPGIKNTPDGWMNRLLAVLPGSRSATDAISVGPTLPRILSGKMPVTNLPLGKAVTQTMPVDRPEIQSVFDRLYNGNDALSVAYQEGQSARKKLLAEIVEDMRIADAGAPSPVGFSDEARKLARLIVRDPSVKLAFLALGGWDTHVNQGSVNGQLSNRLRSLGQVLQSLVQGLGSAYSDTVILVMSEFGRTAHENGNAGTDHGHGNAMWVMGGNVQGRKVYGQWPGISGSDLYEGRDLATTTDFREIIATVLEHHFGLTTSQVDRVLPTRPKPSGLLRGLIRV
jgi:uncharacterized protein (DUF1501 family)